MEASEEKIIYEKIDPNNEQQIRDASLQERLGFATGIDPVELPSVIRYIAEKGDVWLQSVVENGKKNPTGVVEFIRLPEALKFDPTAIATDDDLLVSPFATAMANQKNVFKIARQFALDENIVYHHGIAMSRKGRGYGTSLLNYALEYTAAGIIVCFPDAAKLDEDSGELELVPNEFSFTVHLKAGFILAGATDSPVYDEKIIYYCFLRPERPFEFSEGAARTLNLAEGNAKVVIAQVKALVLMGYVGTEYNRWTHEMIFKLTRPGTS